MNSEITHPLLNVVLSNEYEKKGYGFKKETENVTHWITLFGDGQFQMYAYNTGDPDLEKVYDTGVINSSEKQLQMFIDVLLKNHI